MRDGDPNEYRKFLHLFLKNLVVVVAGLCVRSKGAFVQSETKPNWNWNYKVICCQLCMVAVSRSSPVSGPSVGTVSLYCEGTMIGLISNCMSVLYLCEPEVL